MFEGIKTYISNKVMPKPNYRESSVYDSSLYGPTQFKPFNPDILQQKRGGLDVYREMLTDDQVKAVIVIKTNSIIGSGFHIVPGGDSPEEEEHAKFIEYALGDGLRTDQPGRVVNGFRKSLKKIYSALIYGFSVTEKILKVYKDGPYQGKIGLESLRTRPPHTFEFHSDQYNNLEFLRQNTESGFIDFKGDDLGKFIIYTYDADNANFDDWYGRSDLRAAYRHWWSKDNIIKFRNIFHERFDMGIMVAKYPRGMGPNEQADLSKMIKNISAKTAFKIPQEVTVEILESARRGSATYNESVEKCNIMIARSLLTPNHLGFNESGSGSYNLGEKQFELYMTLLEEVRSDGEDITNDQIIPELINYNFMNAKTKPKFRWNPISEEDKKAMATLFFDAVNKGAAIATEEDENHIREIVGFPRRTDESVLLPRRVVRASPGQGFPSQQDTEDPTEAHMASCSTHKYEWGGKIGRAKTEYEKKVDFEQIIKQTGTVEEEIALGMGRIVSKISDEVQNWTAKKKILENRDTREVLKVDIKHIGEMRLLFKETYRQAYDVGRRAVAQEFGNYKKKFNKYYQTGGNTIGNLPPKEAIEYFNEKSFVIAGVEKEFIKKNVQMIILDNLKTGATQASLNFKLEEFFNQYTVEQLGPDGKLRPVQDIGGRIATIARTNTSDAYNQGRLTMYQEPEINEALDAYQYSAIRDGRITDICLELDGKIYKKNDPIWSSIWPPNHFNCRSDVIGIFSGEKFEITNKRPDVELPTGFGG